jgi:HD-GYP domain-containing protein (c-di-GMP phosphodiesterase class II)
VGWWAVHVLDITGVLGVLGSLWLAPRLREAARTVLGPALARDPLVAFEVGLAPVVHELVAALERKDQLTSDHVVRVGELAGRAAEAMHLPAPRTRTTILGGLLHDIGKLGIDDAVLPTPGRLTADEYRAIQRHTVIGDDLLRAVPTLRAVAPIVRAHHERPDGAGYPDGLSGDAIPLEARIIAACDAYDAMTCTRHYRQGMSNDDALAVLREHAGAQWDRTAVEVVARAAPRGTAAVLDAVGHAGGPPTCVCPDALPEAIRPAYT